MKYLDVGWKGYISKGTGRTDRGFILQGKDEGNNENITVFDPLSNLGFSYDEKRTTLIELTEEEYNKLFILKSEGYDSWEIEEEILLRNEKGEKYSLFTKLILS
jgi:hypothetical protein